MSYIGAQPTTAAFITDQFNGTGSQTAFTLSVAPATTSSILVSVSGVLQDPTTYAVSGTTLTFSAAPPSGTGNISVRFLGIPASGVATTAYRTVTEFTATAGQTSFSVPSYTAGYINVYRNGALLGTSDYTATSGTTVVLANPASSGDLVVTESFYVSSVLNAIPAVAGAVTSSYLLDASVTQAKLAAGVAGNGPAFSAYASAGAVNITQSTWTKVTFGTEEFDTNSNFASSRFTPTVAGYYQITGAVYGSGGGGLREVRTAIYKNGSIYKNSAHSASNAASPFNAPIVVVTSLVYFNGSTDYVEIYTFINDSASSPYYFGSGTETTYFNGCLVRGA